MFYDKFVENISFGLQFIYLHKLKDTEKKHTRSCSHVAQFQLMAYSDGTSGCEPNICTYDLSCFPQGLCVENYSDTIVSACVDVCVCVWSCSPLIL